MPDKHFGEVAISGRLSSAAGTEKLLIVIHGLAGCADSEYAVRTAAAARDAGWTCLRLNTRGADRSGEDIYHAGLTDDLPGVLGASEFRRFTRIAIIGFSLGGHLALRYATEAPDSRLGAVVAVCPPLNLRGSVAQIDRPLLKPYRVYLLHHLRECYLEVVKRDRHVSPFGLVRRAKTLRAWDSVTVVPRFGFATVDDYYEQMSVGPLLTGLKIPSLVIAAVEDPMVPPESLRPYLQDPGENLWVHWAKRGGHVGFPMNFDMLNGGRPGLAEQSIRWIENYC